MEMKNQPVRRFSVHLRHLEKFQFASQASEDGRSHGGEIISDEPDPVGDASGPSTPALLGAAIGHCLSASLLETLKKARIHVDGMEAEVTAQVRPNERGLPRINRIDVRIVPTVSGDTDRSQRCADVFQQYCTVCSSVKEGIPVDVNIDWRIVQPDIVNQVP